MWTDNFLFLVYFFYSSLQSEIDDDRVNLTQLVKNFTRPTFTPVSQVVLLCNEENTLSIPILSDIINFFNRTSCVQFRNVTKNMVLNKKFFNLKNGSYNDITIDETKNLTNIQLTGKCSINETCIKYFFGLALGMIPQVNRENRETYIHVIYSYVNTSDQFRYDKLSSPLFENQNYSFDFGSFFNRNPYYCSKNKTQTYTSKNYSSYYEKMLGQRIEYSFGDRRTFCNYYNIKTLPTVTCQNGGFYNPNTFSCICPEGYIGNDCSTLQETPNCGFQNNSAGTSENYIFACGNKTCYYEITSSNNKIIEMEILAVNTQNITPCISYHGLEIRLDVDKGTTGLSLCGLYDHKVLLKSNSSKVFIGYNGVQNGYFFMSYKTSQIKNNKENNHSISIKTTSEKYTDLNQLDCPNISTIIIPD